MTKPDEPSWSKFLASYDVEKQLLLYALHLVNERRKDRAKIRELEKELALRPARATEPATAAQPPAPQPASKQQQSSAERMTSEPCKCNAGALCTATTGWCAKCGSTWRLPRKKGVSDV